MHSQSCTRTQIFPCHVLCAYYVCCTCCIIVCHAGIPGLSVPWSPFPGFMKRGSCGSPLATRWVQQFNRKAHATASSVCMEPHRSYGATSLASFVLVTHAKASLHSGHPLLTASPLTLTQYRTAANGARHDTASRHTLIIRNSCSSSADEQTRHNLVTRCMCLNDSAVCLGADMQACACMLLMVVMSIQANDSVLCHCCF